MIIGFDAKRAFRNLTGLGNYGRWLIRAVATRYPDHHYLLYTTDPRPRGPSPLPAGAVNLAVAAAPSRWPPAAALWRTFRLGRRAAADGVQVFHGLSNELPEDLPRSVRAVVTIADALPARHPELYPALDRRVYRWKARRAVARADVVVAISEQSKQDAVGFYGADPARVRVIGLDCDRDFGEPVPTAARETARRRHGLPEDYALSVGTLERRKNQAILIEALARLPEAVRPPLVLIGRSTRYRAELEAAVDRLGLRRWVHLPERVPTEDLPALYQGARVFLYPSLFEGFGIPILEALRAGVPVVAANGSSLPEVGGGAARYAPPHDPDAWAAAIGAVLDSSALRALMVAAGQRQAARFDERELARLLMQAYGEVSS